MIDNPRSRRNPDGRLIACIGGAAIDRKYRALEPIALATSNPASGRRSFGGVARNVAENLARLGVATRFASIVGADESGRALASHLAALGVDVSAILPTGARATAEYVAFVDPAGELAIAAADMAIFDLFTPERLHDIWPAIAPADMIFADCNLPAATLAALIDTARASTARVAIDAVSAIKIKRLPADLSGVDLLFLNRDEAAARLGGPISAMEAARLLRQQGARNVIVTAGGDGLAIAGAQGDATIAAPPCRLVDVTGAGDALIAGTLARLVLGHDLADAARAGALLAARTAECDESVRPDLSPDFFAAIDSRSVILTESS